MTEVKKTNQVNNVWDRLESMSDPVMIELNKDLPISKRKKRPINLFGNSTSLNLVQNNDFKVPKLVRRSNTFMYASAFQEPSLRSKIERIVNESELNLNKEKRQLIVSKMNNLFLTEITNTLNKIKRDVTISNNALNSNMNKIMINLSCETSKSKANSSIATKTNLQELSKSNENSANVNKTPNTNLTAIKIKPRSIINESKRTNKSKSFKITPPKSKPIEGRISIEQANGDIIVHRLSDNQIIKTIKSSYKPATKLNESIQLNKNQSDCKLNGEHNRKDKLIKDEHKLKEQDKSKSDLLDSKLNVKQGKKETKEDELIKKDDELIKSNKQDKLDDKQVEKLIS